MFYPTTCVGLGYGSIHDMLSGFSREHGYLRYCLARGRGILSRFDCPPGFAWGVIIYTGLTCYSVSTRECHFSVSTSLLNRVTEC